MLENRILVLDISVDWSAADFAIKLSAPVEVTSPSFNHPHGLAWMDETHLAVGNRCGDVVIFKVPDALGLARRLTVDPLLVMKQDEDLVQSPGSVVTRALGATRHEILVCNNYVHKRLAPYC